MTAITQDLGNIRAIGVQGTVQGQDPYFDWNFRKVSKPIVNCRCIGVELAHNNPQLQGFDNETITLDNNHIYYTQESWFGSPVMVDKYYEKSNQSQNLIAREESIPWLWRNMEPFYIENADIQSITLYYSGPRLGKIPSTDRYVWANIIVDANGEQQGVPQISDDYDVGCPISSSPGITLQPGERVYIFRIDRCSTIIRNPGSWVSSNADFTKYGIYNDNPNTGYANNEENYWSQGVAYFNQNGNEGNRESQIFGAKGSIRVGGNLSSLFIPAKDIGQQVPAQPDATWIQQAITYAQQIFDNPSAHNWKYSQFSFCASFLFSGLDLIDASRLELPIHVPPMGLYGLFWKTPLMYPPKELPALSIYPTSYGMMFSGCENLVYSPIIYANKMEKLGNNELVVIGNGNTHPGDSYMDGGVLRQSVIMNDCTQGGYATHCGISFDDCWNLQSIYLKGGNWGTQGNTQYECYAQGVLLNNEITDWNRYGFDQTTIPKIPTPFVSISDSTRRMGVDIYMRQNIRLYQLRSEGGPFINGGLSVQGYPPTALPVPNSNLRAIDYIVDDPDSCMQEILNIDDPQYHLQN